MQVPADGRWKSFHLLKGGGVWLKRTHLPVGGSLLNYKFSGAESFNRAIGDSAYTRVVQTLSTLYDWKMVITVSA